MDGCLLLLVCVAETLENLCLQLLKLLGVPLLLVHFLHFYQQFFLLLAPYAIPASSVCLCPSLLRDNLSICLHILHAEVFDLLVAPVLLGLLAEVVLPLLFENDSLLGFLAGRFDECRVHEARVGRLD